MASRVMLPESRLRARRRKRRVILLGIVFALLLLFFIGVIFFLRASFLQIDEVRISGIETLATSTVQEFVASELAGNYLYVLPKKNIFLYPRKSIEKDLLSNFPVLKNASVRAETFSQIALQVEERRGAALWCGETPLASTTPEGKCLLLDESGLAYAKSAAESPVIFPRVFGVLEGSGSLMPVQFLSADTFRSAVALARALGKASKAGEVVDVVFKETATVQAYYENGFSTLFSLKSDAGEVLGRFSAGLSSSVFTERSVADFEYLDLRFGDKLYYRLKGGEPQSATTSE